MQTKITLGGWYQRTTLHLSEIYEFLANSNSLLDLDKEKLKQLNHLLNIQSVSRELDNFEYINLETKNGIRIKYYEDGLYILQLESDNIEQAKNILEDYLKTKFEPALQYLFSLGAPTPKLLANIKTTHPIVVTVFTDNPENYSPDPKFGQVYNKTSEKNISMYKTRQYIILVSNTQNEEILQKVVEMQVFFREFKDQLEKYLNIHRHIWTEIEKIKESENLKTKDIGEIRDRLDKYQKTINLIFNRINQMNSYVKTRQSISIKYDLNEHLKTLFQYRFEVLQDTLEYIKEIWQMTISYLNSAIQRVVEIQSQATNKSIQSLTLITTVGVLAGLVMHLSRDSYPQITPIGVTYLLALFFIGWLVNKVIQMRLQMKRYKLSEDDISSDI